MDVSGVKVNSDVKLVLLPVIVVVLAALLLSQVPAWLAKPSTQDKPAGFKNNLGIEFVVIPAGNFKMGTADPAGPSSELPHHERRIASFYLSRYEVTQAQWLAVMGNNPSRYQHPQRPVDQVTWFDVQRFVTRLNQMEGTTKYRLPSEAEWEYAARAGSSGRYFFGDESKRLEEYAWYGHLQNVGTKIVGSKAANNWGLYDMYGNVWEWVSDCWRPNYQDAPADGRVWPGGDCSVRVVRGGGWDSAVDYVGSSVRGSYAPDLNDAANGFRLARDL